MEYKEYRTIDKSKWERGPWDSEPDKMQFSDEATGLPCLIVRNRMGALCGYVGITEGHHLCGKGYEEARNVDDEYLNVHWGLTFADACQPNTDETKGICHTPSEGEPDHVWWFGFDCAHGGDYCPAHSAYPQKCFRRHADEEYRDVEFVKNEIRSLALQLAA